jgi:hypothetical protein
MLDNAMHNFTSKILTLPRCYMLMRNLEEHLFYDQSIEMGYWDELHSRQGRTATLSSTYNSIRVRYEYRGLNHFTCVAVIGNVFELSRMRLIQSLEEPS